MTNLLQYFVGPGIARAFFIRSLNQGACKKLKEEFLATKAPELDVNEKMISCEASNRKLDLYVLEKNSNTNKHKAIVNLYSLQDNYENHLKELESQALRYPNAKVIGFNLRGVGKSTGTAVTQEDWVDDLEQVIRFVELQYNIKDRDIVIYGKSLGAVVGCLYMARHYSKPSVITGPKLLADRAVTSAADEVSLSLLRGTASGAALGLLAGAGLSIATFSPFGLLLGLAAGSGVGAFKAEYTQKALQFVVKSGLGISFGDLDAKAALLKTPAALEHIEFVRVLDNAFINEESALSDALKTEHAITCHEMINGTDITRKTHNAHFNSLSTLKLFNNRQMRGDNILDRIVNGKSMGEQLSSAAVQLGSVAISMLRPKSE